jgi:hypothetical protein
MSFPETAKQERRQLNTSSRPANTFRSQLKTRYILGFMLRETSTLVAVAWPAQQKLCRVLSVIDIVCTFCASFSDL